MGPCRLPRRRPRPWAGPTADEQQPKARQEPLPRAAGASRELFAAVLVGVLLAVAAALPLARAQDMGLAPALEAAQLPPATMTTTAAPTPAAATAAAEEERVEEETMGPSQVDVTFTYANADEAGVAAFQAAVTQLFAPFGGYGFGRSIVQSCLCVVHPSTSQ